MRFREYRGSEDSPESGEGTENLDVTVLGKVRVLLQLLDEVVDAPGQLRGLLVKQAQMRKQQHGGFGQGWGSSGSQRERRLVQQLRHMGGGGAAEMMGGQDLLQVARVETCGLGRQRRGLPEGPGPGGVGRGD